ncbi:MAG: insulinase family protein [Bacteroides sp.]|nr:insulinase family protein [Bacteroides sp.]
MLDYTVFTLPNGLRVVHHRDDSPAHVAVNILYNVGGRDESAELTGMAHLFEHLMFGGSVNVADYDAELEAAGGTSNAWTSNDFTNFYDIVARENVETAFWLESDRMLSPSFAEQVLRTQKSVVIEEFKQTCLNKPYDDMMHHLLPMLFGSHPYAVPTIGVAPDHIERVTMDDIRSFFFSHYAPNNAVLSVVGPISLERTRELAEKWFGPIPSRPIAPRAYVPAAPITEPRRLTVTAQVPQTRLIIAFQMERYGHEQYFAADLITDILSAGNSSRFNRELLMATDIFTDVDAMITGYEETGVLMIVAGLTADDDATIVRAEEAIWDQLRRIASEPVSDFELQRVKNRFESNMIMSQLSFAAKARELAKAVMHGEDYNAILDRYRAISAADITSTASTIFQPSRSCTLLYRPA